MHPGPGAFFIRPLREPGAQTAQGVRAAFGEMHLGALGQQRKPQGAAARVKIRHHRRRLPGLRRGQAPRAHPGGQAVGQVEVGLAKGAGRKVDIHVADAFAYVGFPRQAFPIRAEDGVGARRISVPPETVERIAEERLDALGSGLETLGRRRVANHNQLHAVAIALHNDLEIAHQARVMGVAIGCAPVFAQRLLDRRRGRIDGRVMHAAAGDIDNIVSARRKEPDLGRVHPATHGQTSSAAPAQGRTFDDRRRGQIVFPGQAAELLEGIRRNAPGAESRATGAGGLMGTFDHGHLQGDGGHPRAKGGSGSMAASPARSDRP